MRAHAVDAERKVGPVLAFVGAVKGGGVDDDSPAVSGAKARSSDGRSVTSQSACESGTTSRPAALAALATSLPTWPRGPISARRMRDGSMAKVRSMLRKCGAKVGHSRLGAQRRDHGDDDEKC